MLNKKEESRISTIEERVDAVKNIDNTVTRAIAEALSKELDEQAKKHKAATVALIKNQIRSLLKLDPEVEKTLQRNFQRITRDAYEDGVSDQYMSSNNERRRREIEPKLTDLF